VEIRGSLIEALRGPLRDHVDGVYEHPSVTPVVMNGRRYVEGTERLFDLIYLPAVDGLMVNTRTLFDASEYMHTVESFRAMKARLAPRGVVAVSRSRAFDPELRQFERVFGHLESVGLRPLGLLTRDAYTLLGFDLPEGAPLPGAEAFEGLRVRERVTELAERPALVHDDRPYAVGIPGALIPPRRVAALFGVQLLLFVALGSGVAALLSRRSARARWPVERGPLVMAAGLLVGANFLALEYQLVFVLLRSLEQPFDAVFVATILFLLVSGLGSAAGGGGPDRSALAAGAAALGAAMLFQALGADLLQVIALLPAIFMTGRFFPSVFGSREGRMLRVFAMDAVGAFLATVLAAFVPILFGFTAFLGVVGLLFVTTLLVASRAREEAAEG
jgi:hypothetical protein